ncbi:MAG: helix-turn-helix transcriptional regulator [Duncaniella sp.]|nr:helix-turn-helix transcriptional regulator [Duncaniella sp.]
MAYQRKIPVHTAYPFRLTLNLIQHKWRGCIINVLRSGEPMRLNEIHKQLYMASPRVLNMQIKAMLDDGLLIRTAYDENIPRTEYKLSPVGLSLVNIFDILTIWGIEHRSQLPDKVI